MDRTAIEERRKALEGAFFRKKHAQLLDQLRQQATRRELSEASGITDEKTLDVLVSEGVTASTLTALTLVPLISVAWSDRMMDDRERKAVMSAAHDAGIAAGSDASVLVEGWLAERPPSSLLDAWKQSLAHTLENMDDSARQAMRSACVDRATKVAKATGGFLGVATISAVERKTLAEIEASFA